MISYKTQISSRASQTDESVFTLVLGQGESERNFGEAVVTRSASWSYIERRGASGLLAISWGGRSAHVDLGVVVPLQRDELDVQGQNGVVARR